MINQKLFITSSCQEEKEKETTQLLQYIKKTIERRYSNTFVNLKAQRKGVKTWINVHGTESTELVDRLLKIHVEIDDLLRKNGLTPYPLTKSETDPQ